MSWFFLSLTSRVMLSSERGAETLKPSRDAEKKKRQQKEITFKKKKQSLHIVEFSSVLLVDTTNNSSVLGFELLPDLIVHFKAVGKTSCLIEIMSLHNIFWEYR